MESAKVQKVQGYTLKNLLLELDILNDGIPLNTPYEINGNTVPCLKRAINDIIINYTYNPKGIESITRLKQIFEIIIGDKIEVLDIEGNVRSELIDLLTEMVNKVPKYIPITINGHDYPCLRNVISMVLEGWVNNSTSIYFQERISEIYYLFYINGYTSFKDKY